MIQAKETLIRQDFSDTSACYKDSVTSMAREFIDEFNRLSAVRDRYQHLRDSLEHVYGEVEKKIGGLEKGINENSLSPLQWAELSSISGAQNKDIKQVEETDRV